MATKKSKKKPVAIVRRIGDAVIVVNPPKGLPKYVFSVVSGYNVQTNQYKIVYRKNYYWVRPEDIETRK